MKTEDLKKLGIEDEEIIKQIHALAGKDIEKVKVFDNGHFNPRSHAGSDLSP